MIDGDADLTPSKKKKKKDGALAGPKVSKSGGDESKGAHSKSPALDRIPLPKVCSDLL